MFFGGYQRAFTTFQPFRVSLPKMIPQAALLALVKCSCGVLDRCSRERPRDSEVRNWLRPEETVGHWQLNSNVAKFCSTLSRVWDYTTLGLENSFTTWLTIRSRTPWAIKQCGLFGYKMLGILTEKCRRWCTFVAFMGNVTCENHPNMKP